MLSRKRIALFLLIGLLTVAVSVIPDLVSDELKAWCLQCFGPDYPWYFIVFLVIACFALLAFSGEFKGLLLKQQTSSRPTKIVWSEAAKKQWETARNMLAEAQLEGCIQTLSDLKNEGVAEELSLLRSRLAQVQRDVRAGTVTYEQATIEQNRITKGLQTLIKQIGDQLKEGEQETGELREVFRDKYRKRLEQKLAKRQPVRLRRFVSTEGTSGQVAAAFVPYSSEEIREEIGKTFVEAYGRLLIVGQPGAGKTTLLLQLADWLFDLEADALPVIINLASWRSEFVQLETWLEEVMAAELSTNKAGASAVLRQSGLILLLDGLDELNSEEAINSCLVAIADYGATAGRRFALTCRVEEYKRASEDARVHLQIEIGPLNANELIAELEKVGYAQPEARLLAQAIRNDALLREVVGTPFYFNTLQLLYAGKVPVFQSENVVDRKAEITQKFVEYALRPTKQSPYPADAAERWLAFLAKRMTQKNKVVFELINLQYADYGRGKLIQCLMAGLFFGMVFGVLIGLLFGLYLGLLFGLYLGLFFGMVFIMSDILEKTLQPIIQIKHPYQRFYSSTQQFHFSILKHWHLRYLLYRGGFLPWHLVTFLNDMAARNILETDGATWRFRHRILQDYFAERSV
jgi:Effector-associated domain 11